MLTKTELPPAISVIVPAYCEEGVIGPVVSRISGVLNALNHSHEIIVVDDGSQDETAKRAREAGAKVISHPYTIGPGSAVKTGIRNARGEILVILDRDGQHRPEEIPRLLQKAGRYDMVVGARTAESETKLHRDIANKIYNWFASYICGREIEDLTSGFRLMKGQIAREFVYLLPNTFSYPTTLTLASVRSGYTLTYVPIKTVRRVDKSKIRLFKDGPRFFSIMLKIATFFSPLKVFLPVSLIMFGVGLGYGLLRIFALNTSYGPTSSLLMTVAILIFLIGLVSEQVTQLRFERSNHFRTDDEVGLLTYEDK